MKKLIVLGLIFTLALGIVLVPSAAADECDRPLEIIKVAYGPAEDFTFEAWRDFDNSGNLTAGDVYVGSVVITGSGTGVICVPWLGNYVIREVLIAGSVYPQPPDQIGQPLKGPVTFENTPEGCRLIIEKVDDLGNPLAGACFNITPDPRTGTGYLELCDNDANDECAADGVLCLSELICELTVTVEETVVPPSCPDCEPAPPQTVTISGVVTLTFVNIPPELGELIILKEDGSGNALAGACFNITPNPKTGTGFLEVCDEGLNDEAPGQIGVLAVGDCILGLVCTVEETVAPPGYDPAPPQTVTISGTVELTFVNERCELTIRKVDENGELLGGACFNITPNPWTGTGYLELCDNDANDECPADGVLCLSGLICGLDITVEETVVPDGYTGADPQTATIPATLTFVNTREEADCGTVCAAQTAPGEFLFSDEQSNWFTWIYYIPGWGTEDDPYEYPIYTGIHILCGTLYVYDKEVEAGVTHLFVNYVLTDIPDCTLGGLSEYHLQVDESFDALYEAVVNKGGNPVPGSCEYKDDFDPMVPETGYIEAVNDDITDWTTAYIFAHGVGCYFCV